MRDSVHSCPAHRKGAAEQEEQSRGSTHPQPHTNLLMKQKWNRRTDVRDEIRRGLRAGLGRRLDWGTEDRGHKLRERRKGLRRTLRLGNAESLRSEIDGDVDRPDELKQIERGLAVRRITFLQNGRSVMRRQGSRMDMRLLRAVVVLAALPGMDVSERSLDESQ